jgi:hypothetical protein
LKKERLSWGLIEIKTIQHVMSIGVSLCQWLEVKNGFRKAQQTHM